MKKHLKTIAYKLFNNLIFKSYCKQAKKAKQKTGLKHYVFRGFAGYYVTNENNIISVMNAKRKASGQKFKKFKISEIEQKALYIAS